MKSEKRQQDTEIYAPLFIDVIKRLVNVRNRFLKWKEAFGVFKMRMISSRQEELRILEKMDPFLPNLHSYKQNGLLKQLRLQAVRKGYRSLGEYYKAIVSGKEETEEIGENMTYVGSHFFRGNVWPELQEVCRNSFSDIEREDINIWCAGCSSGKEVYSILLLLLENAPGKKINLLATDYNQTMLKRCKEGCYPLCTIGEIPEKYRNNIEKYIPQNKKSLPFDYRYQFRFKEAIRDIVTTQYLNLITDEYPKGFDMILCRNVMKFFNKDVREKVQRKLSDSLNAGGILVVSDELDAEGITEPEKLHLSQVNHICIYRKI